MKTVTLLFRWGVWLSYTEWNPDQPKEDWSGHLEVDGGKIHSPRLVMYHGAWGPQRRTYIPLPKAEWKSPLLNFRRPLYGYKGVEGLAVELESDEHTLLKFHSGMISVEFRPRDIPSGDRLSWHAGPKFSCSELSVCRIEDEGIYWNKVNTAAVSRADGEARVFADITGFKGDFLVRELHHRFGAWVPPGGTVRIPITWHGQKPVIVTWRFSASLWAAMSDEFPEEIIAGCQSPWVMIRTALNDRTLTERKFKVKYMRGAHSALEHTDELGLLERGIEQVLSITNVSPGRTYLVLYPFFAMEIPSHWPVLRENLPFQAPWFDGTLPEEDISMDLPSLGKGLLLGYDTNLMAAENGGIESVIRFLANTGAGNYILFRTEVDVISAEEWRRWFDLCREKRIHFAINTAIIGRPAPTRPALSFPEVIELARDIGGEYFIGMKQHELSIPIYAGFQKVDFPPSRTLAEAERDFLTYEKSRYQACPAGVQRILGEAMLAHRYAYKAGIDLILSETMTGHTSLLLAEARGAARAYQTGLWGLHIACHVHFTPEGWAHERMLWLNLVLGYLSGASIIEDEEGGLGKVHSFVSGPSDPLPAERQRIIAEFFRWSRRHPRRTPPSVGIGFVYGRHEIITGGLSINTERPVRVWEGFGPTNVEWEYSRPEYGWLLLDLFMPGVWLCPVLQDPQRLRRWFTGTPYGLVDIIPIEAGDATYSETRLLVFPGWNTLHPEDLARYTRYVEQGGTIVWGLAHLQTSDDRTKVLSSKNWDFPEGPALEHLCGFNVMNPGQPVSGVLALGREWDFAGTADGPVHIAGIHLTTGTVVLADKKIPLIVEHRLGRGRVFTFTALEHFGHKGLLPLIRHWLKELVDSFSFPIRVEGGDGEVTWFDYPEETGRRLYFINTDWTLPRNEKICRVTTRSGWSAEIVVREGAVTELFIPHG